MRKNSKTRPALLLSLSLAAVLLAGCQFHASVGIGDFVTGEDYPRAASYQTGAFTYGADEVTAVEIYWHSGEVEIIESDEDELSVRESGGELPEETAMHHLLEDGTLRIRFCESGARIRVDSNDKRLTVEVPRGIDLSVHTTSAPVRADTLEQNSLLISAHSGRTELGTVNAGRVDLSSSSGSIRAGSLVTQTLKGSSSSGSIRIDDLEVETAELNTSSGGVELGLSAASQVEIRTTSGSTVLRLPEGGAALSYTASSGKLRTAEPFERKGDLYVFGGGESRITVSSTSGSLEIQ
ncbi:MAG: DUF4097 family beta strand repeat-containing protein [Oscillospiraceae bacterium]